jgi:hypothetical protein
MRLAPPLSNGEAPPPDELESLLQAYFRAEMPDPWPAPPLLRTAEPQATPAHTAGGVRRSRLALAASVAILLAGTLTVPQQTPTRDTSVTLPPMSPGEATRVRLIQTLVQPKDKPTEWRIEVTEDHPPGK